MTLTLYIGFEILVLISFTALMIDIYLLDEKYSDKYLNGFEIETVVVLGYCVGIIGAISIFRDIWSLL